MHKTPKQWATEVLKVQNAVNSRGVIILLDKVSQDVFEYDYAHSKKGTNWRNRHPLVIMLLSKLVSLAGGLGDVPHFESSYKWCEAVREANDNGHFEYWEPALTEEE